MANLNPYPLYESERISECADRAKQWTQQPESMHSFLFGLHEEIAELCESVWDAENVLLICPVDRQENQYKWVVAIAWLIDAIDSVAVLKALRQECPFPANVLEAVGD